MTKLGQNFLTSTNIAKSIRDAADPTPDTVVLEIGPGKGILTENLLPFVKKLIAIEKDPELVKFLQEKFKKEIEEGKLELIEKDILDFDETTLSFYKDFDYQVIANIPYYITGKIFKKFLESEHQPSSMILMIQKEVGERILAKDGKESILSISVKAYGNPKIIKNVPAKHFIPKPKVDSVVIKIDNISKDFFKEMNEKGFFSMVKIGFSQKRKMLKNNLKIPGKTLQKCLPHSVGQDSEKVRAQDLTLEDWKNLYHQIKNSEAQHLPIGR